MAVSPSGYPAPKPHPGHYHHRSYLGYGCLFMVVATLLFVGLLSFLVPLVTEWENLVGSSGAGPAASESETGENLLFEPDTASLPEPKFDLSPRNDWERAG